MNFDDCDVPVANRVGAEGEGFRFAMVGLDGGRINIAACSLGGAQACLDAARAYVQERRAFGRRLADFQALQFKLADMATELEAARLMVWRAAAALDAKARGRDHAVRHGQAVRHRRRASASATRRCSCTAATATSRTTRSRRYLRDLRVHRILEGTNEIMRVIIARKLLEAA